MSGLNYLLQTNLYLVMFMGFYALLLKNETFFRHNRIYLNAGVLLSFIIPFINSAWFRELFITQQVREAIVPTRQIYETVFIAEDAGTWILSDVLFRIYIAGVALLFAKFLLQLLWLNSNLRMKKGAAFSFFKNLIVDTELPQAETIINHEKVHMRQWHSADIILVELAAIISWFNPVIYLYKKEIRHIHEFIADEEASMMQSKADYAVLLFSNIMGVHPQHLSNNFFNKSLLKRRIMMLHKTKSRRTGLWKYGFSAPLFALMLILSAATAGTEKDVLIAEAQQLISPLKGDKDSLRAFQLKETIVTTREKGAAKTKSKSSLPVEKRKAVDNVLASSATGDTIKTNQTIKDLAKVEVMPQFVGGMKGWTEYLQSNLKYPADAKKNGIEGRVIVRFIVEKDGRLTDIKLLRGIGGGADEEAIRVITESPKWIPGEDKGEAIRVEYVTPIFFKLPAKPAIKEN